MIRDKLTLRRKLTCFLVVLLLFIPSCLLVFGNTNDIKHSLIDQYNSLTSNAKDIVNENIPKENDNKTNTNDATPKKVDNKTNTNDDTPKEIDNKVNTNDDIYKDQINNDPDSSNDSIDSFNTNWAYGDYYKGYKLKYISPNESNLILNKPDRFSYISRHIPLTSYNGTLPNTLALNFVNVDNSVSHISFYLQGDPKTLLSSGYDNYYEYYRVKLGEFVASPNSTSDTVSLSFDIKSAIKKLEGNLVTGAKLVMLVESDPSNAKFYDGMGELILKECIFTIVD